MEFVPLYFADRLLGVNPRGTIGVVTLWSKPDYVRERFREAGVDLNPGTSPIAVFGTLYGNGLREMLRNLLYNPQIQVLLICGHNRSGSLEELTNFFDSGLEPVDAGPVHYKNLAGRDPVLTCRIRQTKRLLDNLVTPRQFSRPPRLVSLGDPKKENTLGEVQDFFAAWRSVAAPELPRLEVPLPEVEVQYYPSNPRGHQVIRGTPLAAWKEVLYLVTRFGRRVTLAKGERLELQHVKVVVEEPQFEPEAELLACHLDPLRLRAYQEEILRAGLRPDEAYHYGDRLRSYFGLDTLAACVERLQQDPEDRKAYISLWDDRRDLTAREGRPCLVSLFFRKFADKLTLSATYRTHNALDAWPVNLYGLMAIQNWVADRVGLPAGAITVVSHSLGLDPRELDRALALVDKRIYQMRLDPCGYFRISLDGEEILVEHRSEDVTLKEYRGRTALGLQHQIAHDLALSDVNHAMYLGRQLAKAELALKEGREFKQD
ncbi:MAG: thymidylate synthase [Thermodesulfobacteriota bacterium]